jgi:UDP-glucose 4-epimerase
MRIALTGATGLIGSAIYERLSTDNDVMRIGRRDANEIYADFSKPESVNDIDLHGVDAVVHCAGVVDEDFQADPTRAFTQSTTGLTPLLRASAESRVKSFVYFSTAHVYGPMTGNISELSPVDPLTDYAIAHYAAEQIIKRHSKAGQFKSLVIRPNAVFGIPVHPDTFDRWQLIPFSFPLDAVRNQKIELRSSGEQKRNFISTLDLAGYVQRFLTNADEFGEHTVLNSAGPSNLSIYEFARKCASIYEELTGNSCIVSRPEPGTDTEIWAHFAFESVHFFYSPAVTTEDYLAPFMREAIKNQQLGK